MAIVKNECVLRSIVAGGLILAVHAYAVAAPFVHAHVGGHTSAHHTDSTVHLHLSNHHHLHRPSSGPEVAADDHDRPIYLTVVVAVNPHATADPSSPPDALDVPLPPRAQERVFPHVVYGHDPPFLRSLSSRAPPFQLS